MLREFLGSSASGVSFAGVSLASLTDQLTLGVALGLFGGKLIGVFGSAYLVISAGWADMQAGASRLQLLCVSPLCDIGFTMSLFIGLLAFADAPHLLVAVKIGILGGSLLAGLLGYAIFADSTA